LNENLTVVLFIFNFNIIFILGVIYTSLESAFSVGYRILFIDIISITSVLCSVFIITIKNPIISVLFLIGLFVSIACYLIVLGFDFIGLSYLLVYVGAVSILFIFILMLINIRVSELLSETINSLPLAITIGILFNYPLNKILPSNVVFFNNYALSINYYNKIFYKNNDANNSNFTKIYNAYGYDDSIYFVTSSSWDSNIASFNHITSIGNVIYTSYSIWLLLTSVILLLAMVGAIIITKK